MIKRKKEITKKNNTNNTNGKNLKNGENKIKNRGQKMEIMKRTQC